MLSRMRALAVSVIALALFGCGGNSTGVSEKGSGIDPSSGSSEGNGSSSGNGSVDPTNAGSVGSTGGSTSSGGYVPQTCGDLQFCPSGEICSSTQGGQRGLPGYCIETCTLPVGITTGKASCPGTTFCVRLEAQTGLGACVLPCGSDGDCPLLTGLEASCVSLDATGPHFCVWQTPATPGGAKSSTP
jgi:hypothetical protein